MTPEEAEVLIHRLFQDEIALHRTFHAAQRMAQRGYTILDVRAVLAQHVLERPPRWNEAASNFAVALLGSCSDARLTRVVLGLRHQGPCVLVTVMQVRSAGNAVRRSR